MFIDPFPPKTISVVLLLPWLLVYILGDCLFFDLLERWVTSSILRLDDEDSDDDFAEVEVDDGFVAFPNVEVEECLETVLTPFVFTMALGLGLLILFSAIFLDDNEDILSFPLVEFFSV